MRADEEIKRDVEAELRWDPRIDATDIAVSVSNAVVELAGFTHSYSEKYEAEHAAKRVAGVVGLANDIEVALPAADERTDPEIARDAVSALKAQLPFSSENIKLVVSHGWITLEGSVEWNYQRERADKAVHRIKGVKGVSNLIQVKPHVPAAEIKRKIEEALARSAAVDAESIQVETMSGTAILRGTVRSWVERQEAERAAWSAPGIQKVDNRIVVSI